ncbi:unnamed protein product [Darwinula stevensoni]|uniref:NADH dehydrogenase [ubiquinone] iron-sulfur protein 5 n=1 Tax=Darwinula stevensoni TaxID=69355 RepID=A0A7R9A7D6_9CRUS|nr:unnamed protein product [Darwinula stevensoni]CAG0891328.1 unnamed protein product [Darwinula stevensoni]
MTQSVPPPIRTPFTDVTGYLWTAQRGHKCADFEIRYMECMEAYGYYQGRGKCKDYRDDLGECIMRWKQMFRTDAIRAWRKKKYQEGKLKEKYAEPPPLDSYSPAT